jgi:hypothetical protein
LAELQGAADMETMFAVLKDNAERLGMGKKEDGGSRGGDPQLMEILNGLKDEYEKIIADSGNFTMD